jgi:hypothetical protein
MRVGHINENNQIVTPVSSNITTRARTNEINKLRR